MGSERGLKGFNAAGEGERERWGGEQPIRTGDDEGREDDGRR